MTGSSAERNLILVFRLLMAWTFIYAASHQAFVANFSVVGFLKSTKTFHDFFVLFMLVDVSHVSEMCLNVLTCMSIIFDFSSPPACLDVVPLATIE